VSGKYYLAVNKIAAILLLFLPSSLTPPLPVSSHSRKSSSFFC